MHCARDECHVNIEDDDEVEDAMPMILKSRNGSRNRNSMSASRIVGKESDVVTSQVTSFKVEVLHRLHAGLWWHYQQQVFQPMEPWLKCGRADIKNHEMENIIIVNNARTYIRSVRNMFVIRTAVVKQTSLSLECISSRYPGSKSVLSLIWRRAISTAGLQPLPPAQLPDIGKIPPIWSVLVLTFDLVLSLSRRREDGRMLSDAILDSDGMTRVRTNAKMTAVENADDMADVMYDNTQNK